MQLQINRLSAAIFVVALMLVMTARFAPGPAEGASLGLRFPAPAGTKWTVASGYNTATHLGVDPYALDLVRADGEPTAGTPVLAPVSGTLGGGGTGDCAWIRTDVVTVLMCHIITQPFARNTRITQGQLLGTVAPEGQKGNNGLAHIHLAVNVGGSSGTSLPFDGDYILDGVALPATASANAYSGTAMFTSTNALVEIIGTQVSAGADQQVDPGQRVTLSADSATGTSYSWSQVGGATVAMTRSGRTATFTAPDSPGAVLQFQVTATAASGVGVDTVEVKVRVPIPADQRGRIIAGVVQANGLSLVMFGGGTNAELVSAAGCGTTSATFWVTVQGRYVGFIPAAGLPGVNAEWNATFPDGIPANTPMIVRCR